MALAGCISPFAPTWAFGQALDQARDQFIHGQYQAVIEAAKTNLDNGGYSSEWRVLLAKALLTVGRYDEAHTNALAAMHDASTSAEVLLLVRQTMLFQNDLAGANRQLEKIDLLIQRRGQLDLDPENIVPLGRALLLLGLEPRLVLENCFQRAEKMNPPIRDAFLASGELGLEKHDFTLAADAFRAGLKKFPDDPDMQAGLARAYEPSDREEMLKAARAALAGNPKQIAALLLLADHLIDAEQYDEAEAQIVLALEVNPSHPGALAYRSVLAHLQNNPALEQQYRSEALKHWKTNPEADYLIGRKLSQQYLFAEGAAAQRRALDFDPSYLPARRQLAEDMLRLGENDEGWRLAQEAHSRDKYDVTTFNLVTLHDKMMKFRTLTNADFILHMSPLEAQLYGDRALDLLGRARAALCRKYGVELTRPTVVEIFPEQKDFGVRTFGMPGNPGYLGVCFGSVITANSPASQAPNPANWEDVLWHEFCHVVTLTDTKNRMPRWLSEGISVYEERQANPAWGEKLNLAYRDLILSGKLTPLGQLSGAFLAPKNGEMLQFAYYESSLVVEFIVQKFGLDALKQILADLRDGRAINDSIAARTKPLAEMEKQFDTFAQARARELAPGVDLEKPPTIRGELGGPNWEESHPKNYYLRLRKAHEAMAAKRWADAKPLLESLAADYHGESRAENPIWLLAVTERNLKDADAELAALQRLALQEADYADLYIRLIEISRDRKDWKAASDYAEKLLAINPLVAAPHRALADAGIALGKNDQAITACRKLLLLDPPDPAQVHFDLARLLHARGDAESEAKRHVLQALENAPRFRDAQRLLLQIEATPDKPADESAHKGQS